MKYTLCATAPPVILPPVDAAGSYEVSFKHLGDDNFDSERGATFWNLNNDKYSLYFTDFKFVWINGNDRWEIELDGIGVKGYAYYKSITKAVKIVAQYDYPNKQKRLYADGWLVASKTDLNMPAVTGTLNPTINNVASYDKYSGVIDEFVVSTTLTTIVPKIDPTEIYDDREVPAGYTPYTYNYAGVADALTQLQAMRIPNLRGKTAPIKQVMNLYHLAGGTGSYSAPLTTKYLQIADILTRKFGHAFRVVDNLNAYYADRLLPNNMYSAAIAYLSSLPANTTINVGSSWAQIDDIGGDIAYTGTFSPTLNISASLTGDKNIREIQATQLAADLGSYTVHEWLENGEKFSLQPYQNAPEPQGAQAYVDQYNFISEGILNVFPNVKLAVYDVHHGKWYNDKALTWDVLRYLNHNGALGACSMYPRTQLRWWKHAGNLRGLQFLLRSRAYEVQSRTINNVVVPGEKNNSPVIALGWHEHAEDDIQPTPGLGIIKAAKLIAGGALNAAYFHEGVYQEPKQWAWQPAAYAYAEEAYAKYYDILTQGDLLAGDVLQSWYYGNGQPQPEYHFKTNDKQILCVGRKLGNKYLFCLTYQPLNPYRWQPNAKIARWKVNGQTLEYNARKQGTVIYCEEVGGVITIKEQTDKNHFIGHYTKW